MAIYGRTDLASEARGLRMLVESGSGELPGVRFRQETMSGMALTRVEILDERGREALGKAPGRYWTLELPGSPRDSFEPGCRALAQILRECMGAPPACVCVAALGNPDITPDALGPLTASQILVTRHLKAREGELFSSFASTVLCRTGVLGTSGLESAAQVKAFCQAAGAELVIAVDALAGSVLEGLCRSVQVCDTGIAPGSGVGNDRQALDRQSLGIPVIALGVPTVIDASALSPEKGLEGLFVTPRDIDSSLRTVSRILAYGINMALHPGLSPDEISGLVG